MKKTQGEFVRADGESGFKSLGGPARLLCALLIPLACWLPVTPVERVLLIASLLLVLIVELLNSALEAVVDRISLEAHDMSRRAKDFGSAAVLLCLVLVALVWVSLGVPAMIQLVQ
jgi:diacylglycerol kinase (ATP)